MATNRLRQPSQVNPATPPIRHLAAWRPLATVNSGAAAMDTTVHPATAESRESGGAEGNERLTAMTGAVLLVLLLVECYYVAALAEANGLARAWRGGAGCYMPDMPDMLADA